MDFEHVCSACSWPGGGKQTIFKSFGFWIHPSVRIWGDKWEWVESWVREGCLLTPAGRVLPLEKYSFHTESRLAPVFRCDALCTSLFVHVSFSCTTVVPAPATWYQQLFSLCCDQTRVTGHESCAQTWTDAASIVVIKYFTEALSHWD